MLAVRGWLFDAAAARIFEKLGRLFLVFGFGLWALLLSVAESRENAGTVGQQIGGWGRADTTNYISCNSYERSRPFGVLRTVLHCALFCITLCYRPHYSVLTAGVRYSGGNQQTEVCWTRSVKL